MSTTLPGSGRRPSAVVTRTARRPALTIPANPSRSPWCQRALHHRGSREHGHRDDPAGRVAARRERTGWHRRGGKVRDLEIGLTHARAQVEVDAREHDGARRAEGLRAAVEGREVARHEADGEQRNEHGRDLHGPGARRSVHEQPPRWRAKRTGEAAGEWMRAYGRDDGASRPVAGLSVRTLLVAVKWSERVAAVASRAAPAVSAPDRTAADGRGAGSRRRTRTPAPV